MKTKKVKKLTALIVLAMLLCAVAVTAFALTGSASANDHDITLNQSANYNKIKCTRSLNVAASSVTGKNIMTWYTYTGDQVQKAYSDACIGTSTVTVRGRDGDNVYITPKTTTVNVLGANLADGITCTAIRHHNLELTWARAVYEVVMFNPDGNVVLYNYSKTITIE